HCAPVLRRRKSGRSGSMRAGKSGADRCFNCDIPVLVFPVWGTLMAEVKSDIEIARAAKKKLIIEIGGKLGIPAEHLLPYGHDKAKITAEFIASKKNGKDGKLILVTAINPTPAGEGRTTTTVGLGDGLNRIRKKAVVCIREASLGPNFGMKGGAA